MNSKIVNRFEMVTERINAIRDMMHSQSSRHSATERDLQTYIARQAERIERLENIVAALSDALYIDDEAAADASRGVTAIRKERHNAEMLAEARLEEFNKNPPSQFCIPGDPKSFSG